MSRALSGVALLRGRTRPARALAIMGMLGCAAMGALAEDPDVRRAMSEEEFRAAGLQRLSEDELAALNRWLIRYVAREAPTARLSSAAVRTEVEATGAEVIRSRIVSESPGARGRARYRLENGQVWQLRRETAFHVPAGEPEVEIRRNALGFFDLRLLESGRNVGVTRVE